jgi:hypothetical protein
MTVLAEAEVVGIPETVISYLQDIVSNEFYCALISVHVSHVFRSRDRSIH